MLNSDGVAPWQPKIVGGDVLYLQDRKTKLPSPQLAPGHSQHNGSAVSTIPSVQEGHSRQHLEDVLIITVLRGKSIGKMCPKRCLGRSKSGRGKGVFAEPGARDEL